MLQQIVTIARSELLRRVRSRSAIITAFIAPLAMATVFGVMFDGSSTPSFTVGVVDEAQNIVSGQITRSLLDDEAMLTDDSAVDGAEADEGSVELIGVGSRAEAAEDVDDAVIGAAIVIGDDQEITVLISPASPLTGQVAQSLASSIATSVETGQRAPTPMTELPVGGRELSAPTYFGASMSILLLFFATGLAAQSILEDKESRTLDRILAGPTTTWAVLIGKVVAVSILAIAGFITVWVATTLVFGAEWGDPLSVLVLIVFTVFSLAGVATFVGGFAKTSQQAITITAVVTFGLSLLGGNFTGPADAPAALRAARRVTPNGRALEAFTDLSVDSSSLASIATTLLVLLAFGVVFGAVGLSQIRKTVAS